MFGRSVAAAALLAVCAGAEPSRAEDIRDADTVTLALQGSADTVQVRGWRSYYGGYGSYYGYRSYYGYPYYGYGNPYYYAPSYSFGFNYYRPYTSYYYAPPVYYYSPSLYYYYPIAGNGTAQQQPAYSELTIKPRPLQPPTRESVPLPPPSPGDATYPYDGGPQNPVPMPRSTPAPMKDAPPATVPLEGRVVSLPVKTVENKFRYSAYGEQPTSTFGDLRSVKATSPAR